MEQKSVIPQTITLWQDNLKSPPLPTFVILSVSYEQSEPFMRQESFMYLLTHDKDVGKNILWRDNGS